MNPLARPGPSGTAARAGVLLVAVALLAARVWYFYRLNGWYWLTVLTAAVQFTVIIAGVIAIKRRPASRVGLILLGWGFYVSAATGVGAAESGAILVIGHFLQPWYWSFLAHAMLTYPDGRTQNRMERVFLTVGYLWPLWWFTADLFAESSWLVVCPPEGCKANPFLITADRPFFDLWFVLNNIIALAIGVWFLVLVVLRRRRMAAPQRSSAAPALWAIGVLSVAYLMQAVLSLFQVADDNLWDVMWWTRRLATLLVPLGLLIALVNTKLARADVAQLLLRLRSADIDELQGSLAKLLRDPTVEIVSAVADDERREATELGDGLFLLHHGSAREEDPELFEAGVTAARMTIDNTRLNRQVQAQLAEVSASRQRLVHAAEAERKRVERDLHDGAQQQLIGVGIALETARLSVPDAHPAAPVLDDASGQLRQSIDELRSLARGLRPAMLTERGLATALAELRRRAKVPFTLEVNVGRRLSQEAETTAYFVISEALQNARRHAPGALIRVHADLDGQDLVVTVHDDGPGGADATRGSGLRGLSDRVTAIGGQLTVESRAGAGTTVWARIPCEEAE